MTSKLIALHCLFTTRYAKVNLGINIVFHGKMKHFLANE